jgi:hypothetical protein
VEQGLNKSSKRGYSWIVTGPEIIRWVVNIVPSQHPCDYSTSSLLIIHRVGMIIRAPDHGAGGVALSLVCASKVDAPAACTAKSVTLLVDDLLTVEHHHGCLGSG